MKTVRQAYDYEVNADELFALATDWQGLQGSMSGIAAYRGLPETAPNVGDRVEVTIRLFGWLPAGRWTISILEHDIDERRIRSHEYGGAVKSWDHTLTVESTIDGARLHDEVTIEAGWLTGLYAAWARYIYAARDKARRRMLGLTTGLGEGAE